MRQRVEGGAREKGGDGVPARDKKATAKKAASKKATAKKTDVKKAGAKKALANTAAPARVAQPQYGALPYRLAADGTVEVMLITSRETRRWVIPKGWPMRALKPHRTAEQEAFEEAGLKGKIGKTSIGRYGYKKKMADETTVPVEVTVFPLEVSGQHKRWPEKDQRDGRWFSAADAATRVEEDGLRQILATFRKPAGATESEPSSDLIKDAQAIASPKRARRQSATASDTDESRVGEDARVARASKGSKGTARNASVRGGDVTNAKAAKVGGRKKHVRKATSRADSVEGPRKTKARKAGLKNARHKGGSHDTKAVGRRDAKRLGEPPKKAMRLAAGASGKDPLKKRAAKKAAAKNIGAKKAGSPKALAPKITKKKTVLGKLRKKAAARGKKAAA